MRFFNMYNIYCYIYMCVYIYIYLFIIICLGNLFNIPVIPHKVVAEVSRIGHYRRGGLL